MATPRQGSALLYVIMVFGFVMGYLYNLQSDPAGAVPVLDNRFAMTSLKNLEGAKVDQSVFTSDSYKALRVFGSLPVQPGAGGKDNPFQ
jgi:hypothetical protein